MSLAAVLAAKGWPAHQLVYVGVYCGIADPRRDGRTASARQKQVAAWRQSSGLTVVTRPLRYPHGWPNERAQEKGIDVKLAIDAVMLAVQKAYDVAIIASCDSDLAPVAEALLELQRLRGGPGVRVVAWKGLKNRIGITGRPLTYQLIDERDYHAMQDLSDYAA